jgi:hypothetical protein
MDTFGVRSNTRLRCLVMTAGDYQSSSTNIRQSILDGPIAETTRDVKLVRAIHRVMNGWVSGDRGEATLNFLGEWNHAAEMSLVENVCRLFICRITGRARRFVPKQCRLHVRREGGTQAIGLAYPGMHGSR